MLPSSSASTAHTASPVRDDPWRPAAIRTTVAVLAISVACAGLATAQPPAGDLPDAVRSAPFDEADRLEILNLLAAYSHLADGLHTEAFGRLFTDEAPFSVVPPGEALDPERHAAARGREAIVAMLRPRHRAFASQGVQRRHFLTNPLVREQTETTARVAVYLQLRSSENGSESKLVATGRYEGRVVETPAGWRLAEWTFYADQKLE